MSVKVDDSGIRSGGLRLDVLVRVFLVSLVAIIGWNIALPGLDDSFVEARSAQGFPSQLSILALGVGPILTALALGQIIRLIFPRSEGAMILVVGEGVIALLLAALQAYGVANAMSIMGILADQGDYGVLSIVVSLVGGTAVLLFLSRLVTLPNLTAGLWILWLLPALIALPLQLSNSFELLRTGAVGASQTFVAMLAIVGAAALCIFATRAVMADHEDRTQTRESTRPALLLQIVVWPPLLAAIVAGNLLTPVALLAPDALPDARWLGIYVLAMTALLIPVFVFGYRRFFAHHGVTLSIVSVLILAPIQIILVLGGAFAAEHIILPLPFGGTTMLVLVAVVSAMIDAARRLARDL